MTLQEEIKNRSAQEVLNDNDLFDTWINENLTLTDVLRRCPDVESMIFEEFNNDWFEEVQNEAAEIGITIDEIGAVVGGEEDAAWDAGYNDGFNEEESDAAAFPDYENDYSYGYQTGLYDARGL